MRAIGSTIDLSASDLSQFLGCRHRTALDLAVAQGLREAPAWIDPLLMVLQERGLDHEKAYVDTLRVGGFSVTDLSALSVDQAVPASLAAMRAGAAVILQPALREGRWFGRPDLLRRVETASIFGPWSYEVADTKLARETRGSSILQLCVYSELLRAAQGLLPDRFYVIPPYAEAQPFRVRDFSAYFRLICARLDATTALDPVAIAAAHYPEPVEHCDVCRWWSFCDKRRRADDHLSFVAGISRLQRSELQAAGITTLTALGSLPVPLAFVPRRGASETYLRVREQARVQLAGRVSGSPAHELFPIVEDHGFLRMPAPSPGDVFLDLEGDSFAREGGREYLFGLLFVTDGHESYRAFWAIDDTREKAAFEAALDAILESWEANPNMHVYHYAPYETAAFKRLMGRHATREIDVDRMLRAGLFVDLHAIVKRSLRASVEKYSIKDLEPFYGFRRALSLEDARTNLRIVDRALELESPDGITAEVRAAVEAYNRDDCMSALQLRGWLEQLRAEVERGGTYLPRPPVNEAAPSEPVGERERRARELGDALLAGVPAEPKDRDGEPRARWLLANLLGWQRREEKAPWWEFFRLCDLTDEELAHEKDSIAGLAYTGRIGGTAKCPIDRFTYPFQETDIRERDELHLTDGTKFGSVENIDRVTRTIDVKKVGKHTETYPNAVFAFRVINGEVLEQALFRIAAEAIETGLSVGTRYRAASELLLSKPPRLRSGAFESREGEATLDFAKRTAQELSGTVLAIQGPPGAGKTYTGAAMICDLVLANKRVGVTAVSHKVIRNLLDAVLDEAKRRGIEVCCAQKVRGKVNESSFVEEFDDNAMGLSRLKDRGAQVLGATAWTWARPEFEGALDVLFVDEAGQMSLANVLAVSPAADSLVLLGDPQQLEQPQQGSHPEGTDVSALEHLLGDHQTIPAGRGIFLPQTWRLSPSICVFTSEVFYDSRLEPLPGLEQQTLVGTSPFEGAGLWVVPVVHEGNQSSSVEEVDVVARISTILAGDRAGWIDRHGETRPLLPSDIIVVAPYNAQVARLEERLGPQGIRVGTVDRFQGQEAPVVIYSMATSSPEDAPRGMEFVYSLNRLNVATSRARCACILVANPKLFEPECKTPRQMKLANALCRYVELARVVSPEDI